jgi:glycerol-3-phosphate dehydrogenase
MSRDHVIHIDASGLMTICGGKWTTYRHMAEDCVDQAATLAQLGEKPCVTRDLRIHGYHASPQELGTLAVYGTDAAEIRKLIDDNPRLGDTLHRELPYVKAEVVWAVRHEMARTVEDVLARRTRALFLNARAALEMAPVVADLMMPDLGWNHATKAKHLSQFREVAANFLVR